MSQIEQQCRSIYAIISCFVLQFRKEGSSMRIAAGVLILIVAVMDLLAGAGYLFVGSAASGGGGALQEAINQEATRKGASAADVKAAQDVANAIQDKGPMLKAFGAFLLVLGLSGIGAGVVLFMKKALSFAMGVGVLQIIADIIAIAMWGVFGLGNILGVLAGIFVIAGVMMTKKAMANPAPVGAPGRPM
jgi:hypothetical protein